MALHVVKLACERPQEQGRSLSQWDAPELARQLVEDGTVESIRAQTVQRVLAAHQLKPWRQHLWLSAKTPRDAAFGAQVQALAELYTRALAPDEMVLSVDEKTRLQPRPRLHPTLPARPGQPVRVEHEYRRAGALHLLAAFDTRSGQVHALTAPRKRPGEFIALLEHLAAQLPATIQRVHLGCDNVSVHKGQQVQAWLALHPRFGLVFTPVHCSWMNQVEPWFSILQRKRLRIADFADKTHLAQQLARFVAQWNARPHPFHWSSKSVARVMAKCQPPLAVSELQTA